MWGNTQTTPQQKVPQNKAGVLEDGRNLPTELRRHLETKKMRQVTPLQSMDWFIIEVTYSHGWEHNQVDWKTLQLLSHTWDNFIVNLGNGGRGSETAHAFLVRVYK